MEQRLSTTPQSHEEATARLIESAESLGIEIDREEADRWIAALSAESFGNLTVDFHTGIHGHRVTVADHDPGQRERYRRMAAISLADYVERLTDEVYKYTVTEPNHGKAARRMYNIFRLTGRDREAAYIRELFDEPVTALYQVAALLRALDEAADAGDAFKTDALVAQVDGLIMSAIAALEGRAEADVVRRLLRLRDAVSSRESSIEQSGDIVGVRDEALRAVNDYFERVLTAVPSIKSYLDSVSATRRTTESRQWPVDRT